MSFHVIIIGFGLAGRSVVNAVIDRGTSYCVIERNVETVRRCELSGLRIIEGDAREPEILNRAGIDRATIVAVTIPDNDAAMETVEQARRMNPNARIIARCAFVSDGLEAHRRGANDVVVAEQVVAGEFSRIMEDALGA